MSNRIPDDLVSKAREWRHDFHRHPELAYQEVRTSDRVAEILGEAGIEVRRGFGQTGLVGSLTRGSSDRQIMLRADMDALPIEEASGVDHRSETSGVMHACGHDGHTAMLLAAATELARSGEFDGTVHFLFQPAEENEAGAKAMIEDGVLDAVAPESCFAAHNWPDLDVGWVAAVEGPIMAAFSVFEITVGGTGSHAAMPNRGTDAVLAAARITEAVQSIVSRGLSPQQAGVISITQIHGGDAYNVLPDTVTLRGTARWFEPQVGDMLEERLGEMADLVARANGCSAELRYERRYPPTVNTPEDAAFIRRLATEGGLEVDQPAPSMAAEDFAFFLQERPGCYFWIGSGDDDHSHGLHSSKFDFNDAILETGIGLWVRLVETRLSPSG